MLGIESTGLVNLEAGSNPLVVGLQRIKKKGLLRSFCLLTYLLTYLLTHLLTHSLAYLLTYLLHEAGSFLRS